MLRAHLMKSFCNHTSSLQIKKSIFPVTHGQSGVPHWKYMGSGRSSGQLSPHMQCRTKPLKSSERAIGFRANFMQSQKESIRKVMEKYIPLLTAICSVYLMQEKTSMAVTIRTTFKFAFQIAPSPAYLLPRIHLHSYRCGASLNLEQEKTSVAVTIRTTFKFAFQTAPSPAYLLPRIHRYSYRCASFVKIFAPHE
ncbi:hypothetical protein KIN20_027759 [Parelaphostrongylus tenuis]|uniref:Uncharacterized protein n=1 Tax=Parelaphostrongylus tenuis TaxID=148309 RepID=A0AAD5WE49_PARTN|nr:hypothetical protein KIN20_027759 [Parelaphostrongylus tenuis]